MPLLQLKISTRVLLHPGFVETPALFAKRHQVELIGDVFPSTSFKKNPETNTKDETVKANIHLVRDKAIRLFTESDVEGDWIRSIEVNPALLLYGDGEHTLNEQDLVLALSALKKHVAPLLADPLAACHIIPGLVAKDKQVAYWRRIKSELLIPGVDLLCLHGVSHPDTGPPDGSSETRLKLGDRGDCVIIIEAAKWNSASPSGTREVRGLRVTLTLRGDALLFGYRQHGEAALVGDVLRPVGFHARGVTRVHQECMSRLEGFHLPVPTEWAAMGKPLTPAKVIALLSHVTSRPLDELRAKLDEQSQPSASTRKRLNKDVPEAVACLKPVPVSSLFLPEAYATRAPEMKQPVGVTIDPLVAAAYGTDTPHLRRAAIEADDPAREASAGSKRPAGGDPLIPRP